MKKIDDKDILEKFSKVKDYEVKSTSDDVLNKFLLAQQAEKVRQEEKTTSKKKVWIFGGATFGTLAVTAATLITVFSLQPKDNPIGPGPGPDPITPSFSSIEGNILANEFLTFSSFGSFGDSSSQVLSLNNRIFKAPNLKDSDFERIVDDYDSIQNGVIDILNKDSSIKMIKEKEFNEEINGETYLYVDEYYSSSDDFKTPFMYFYYNDKNVGESLDNEEVQNGVLKFEDEIYSCSIQKESEIESDEKEEEISIFLRNDKNIIHIEKESEYEGHESENSYSIYYYDSDSYRNDDDDNFIYHLCYEIENEGHEEELEISVETQNTQCEFQNISLVDEDPLTYSFGVEYEDERNDIEVEDLKVTLTYQNNERIYETSGLEKIIKK